MKRSISLVGIILGLAAAVFGQEARSTIQGSVKDPQGAMVTGANVTVTALETKTVIALKTNDAGRFVAPLLIPGPYSVSVEAPGFKKSLRDDIELLTGDRKSV